MNTLNQINTSYLRASRTIETVVVSNGLKNRTFFIYNYEGISYSVFKNHDDLIYFFQNQSEEDHHFSTEKQLDRFLQNIKLEH